MQLEAHHVGHFAHQVGVVLTLSPEGERVELLLPPNAQHGGRPTPTRSATALLLEPTIHDRAFQGGTEYTCVRSRRARRRPLTWSGHSRSRFSGHATH